jgi:hypothetical protein
MTAPAWLRTSERGRTEIVALSSTLNLKLS